VLALQEVLRPFAGDDPLTRLAERLRLHVAFVTTRIHRLGELGNAILSRWPIAGASLLDLSFSRVERRSAVAALLRTPMGPLSFVATHLSLVHRTRRRQVRHLLGHPTLQGPVFLLGDMNAWRRRDRAGRALDAELHSHSEVEWPASFPAARPMWPLDRIYSRGAKVVEIEAHQSIAARRASDHLPVVARVALL
jgi:endonuclease/exonuclease/phosphatase family metal-dependent hydrolase